MLPIVFPSKILKDSDSAYLIWLIYSMAFRYISGTHLSCLICFKSVVTAKHNPPSVATRVHNRYLFCHNGVLLPLFLVDWVLILYLHVYSILKQSFINIIVFKSWNVFVFILLPFKMVGPLYLVYRIKLFHHGKLYTHLNGNSLR